MQRAGEVSYAKVSLTFQCAFYDTNQPGEKEVQLNETKAKEKVIFLQDYIKDLEGKLAAWKNSVVKAREKFYHLNYFTTLQLLQLRKELGVLTQDKSTRIVIPQVLLLLQSVSPLVTSSVVTDALQALVQLGPMDCEGREEDLFTVKPAVDNEQEGEVHVFESANSSPDKSIPQAMPSPPPRILSPMLTYEDLTEVQLKNFTDLCSMGFSDGHILKAFEECAQKATVYDIEQWCEDNEDCSSQEEECSVGMADREEEMPFVYNPQEESDSDEDLGKTSAQLLSQTNEGKSMILNCICRRIQYVHM